MKYKIIVLRNGANIDIKNELAEVTNFYSRMPIGKPINVEFTVRDSNIPVSYQLYAVTQGFNSKTGQPMQIQQMGIADTVKDAIRAVVKEGECNEVMFINDITSLPVTPGIAYENFTNFKPLYFNTGFTQIVYNSYLKQNGVVGTAIKHEPMHDFVYTLNRYGYPVQDEMDRDRLGRPYYKNNFPEDPDSNFGFTFKNMFPYIDKLVPVAQSGTYKYFSPAEVAQWKLKPELFLLLDKARGLAGVPFIITSGLRSVSQNASVGGKPNSAHLKGLAVDLLCTDNLKRTVMIKGVLQSGPVFLEIAKAHLHIDLDATIHQLGSTIVSDDE